MKIGSGKQKMRLGLGLAALGVTLLILGNQAIKKNQDSASHTQEQSVSYRSITKQDFGADVVEFFWYGCPHCSHLERSLQIQSFHGGVTNTLLADGRPATFSRIPAPLNDEWTLGARLFFALDHQGVSEEGQIQIMDAVREQRPKTREQMKSLLAGVIIPRLTSSSPSFSAQAGEIDERMFSSSVDSRIESAKQLAASAGISGVPVMVVNGEKIVSLGSGTDYETMGPKVLSLLGKSGK